MDRTLEIIRENLKEIILSLEIRISELNEKDEMIFLFISLKNLANYTLTLHERSKEYEHAPIEFIANMARNMFETYLLVAYILSEPSKAKEFIGQKASDELEIAEGFLSLTNKNTPEQTINSIQNKIHFVKNLMTNNSIPTGKHWSVKELAFKTKNRVEYDAFFKLHSKYIHPSSWIVNSKTFDYDAPEFRSIFISQCQIYADYIRKLLLSYLYP
jgi:hypothetical protein